MVRQVHNLRNLSIMWRSVIHMWLFICCTQQLRLLCTHNIYHQERIMNTKTKGRSSSTHTNNCNWYILSLGLAAQVIGLQGNVFWLGIRRTRPVPPTASYTSLDINCRRKVLPWKCPVASSSRLAKWADTGQQNGGPQTVIRHLSDMHSYLWNTGKRCSNGKVIFV